jgi:hypothetical protein
MDRNAIAIIHFNPIELYPPITNLLNYLAEKMPATNVYVFTNNSGDAIPKYSPANSNIIIRRVSVIDPRFSLLKRYRNYFCFYWSTYASLRKIHPKWLWYFETLSALPASWYFRHKTSQDTKLLIHYHEYMSPAEYKNGPRMVEWIHHREKKLYNIVHTLSHTNEKRMQLFLRDNGLTLNGRTHILPNYPPRSWISARPKMEGIGYPVRVVYVGAIGMESTYIREFCSWVDRQNGKVHFDIYSHQDTGDLRKLITESKWRFIDLKGYTPYKELREHLLKYDVGVILYKGHIPNYIYNAPNKLFEYWACGLDIWFPDKMTGSLQYAGSGHYPKRIAVDFHSLDSFNLDTAISHSGLTYQPSGFYCEKIIDNFLREI